jgi:D-alanyl-D-alanine carboxypeptidase (penicillin-binding protein 5/6)
MPRWPAALGAAALCAVVLSWASCNSSSPGPAPLAVVREPLVEPEVVDLRLPERAFPAPPEHVLGSTAFVPFALTVPAPQPWAAPPAALGRAPAPEVSAAAAIVIDEASGAVLYQKYGYRSLPIASLTKIATGIVLLERGSLDDWVETDVDSRTMTRSSLMGLLPGDRFTLRDLLYGMLLPSGNDAAIAIARGTWGTEPAFVDQMNAMARRLGLFHTSFTNSSGLGNQLASAYDIAMLARYAMTFPEFAQAARTGSYTARGSRTIVARNINPFLGYPGSDGIKNGYTRSAGNTLVASATRDGHRVYVVVLNAPARDSDSRALMEWAFANHRWDGQ